MMPPRLNNTSANTRPIKSKETIDHIAEKIPSLQSFARSLTRDPNDADDLVQETLLKALSNADKFEPGTRLRSWLFTILKNTFYTRLRQDKRYRMLEGSEAENLMSVPPSQEQKIHVKEVRAALWRLLPKHRQALLAVVISEDSYEQAAKKCQCPVGTIKSRLSRAREHLLAELEEFPRSPLGHITSERKKKKPTKAYYTRKSVDQVVRNTLLKK